MKVQAPEGYHFDRGGFLVEDQRFWSRFSMDAAKAYHWWYFTPIWVSVFSLLLSTFAVLNSFFYWVP